MNLWKKRDFTAHANCHCAFSQLMRKNLWTFFAFFFLMTTQPALSTQEPYQFYGRHFIAQYCDCDHGALCNTQQLAAAMKAATNASGARLLGIADYKFEGNGYTMVLLLSESHASIHTYPEYNACFVDLFTCGQKCSAEKFDAALRQYLKPKRIDSKIQERR
jgi:S-adenosylmethionine decarboxylase